MPFLGIGLHVIIALYFGIHAVRRGHNMYWLVILFLFPLLGSIAYFFVIFLPELRDSRTVRSAQRVMKQVIDPGRELREARRAFELTPTTDNRLRLAKALLNAGDAVAALQHYTDAAQGPFAQDLYLLLGLASAQFAVSKFDDARATLEKLFAANADAKRHPEVALLYARILAEARVAEAREAFGAALVVASDAEPKCRFADWLIAQGGAADRAQAKDLYAQIVKDSGHWHRHAKTHNAEWLRRARTALNA